MMSICPSHICACRGKIRGEGGAKRTYLHTAWTLLKPLGIYFAEPCILIIELTGFIQYDKSVILNHLLMAAESAPQADILP